MTVTQPDSATRNNVSVGGLFVAILLTLIVALAGNALLALLATSFLDIPETFVPLTPARFVALTSGGVLIGSLVLVLMLRRLARPLVTFRRVAWIALLLSFIPDLAMLSGDFMPGATVPGVITLMLMHVVAGLSCIYLLPRLARLD